jgi:hypothetical protein
VGKCNHAKGRGGVNDTEGRSVHGRTNQPRDTLLVHPGFGSLETWFGELREARDSNRVTVTQ